MLLLSTDLNVSNEHGRGGGAVAAIPILICQNNDFLIVFERQALQSFLGQGVSVSCSRQVQDNSGIASWEKFLTALTVNIEFFAKSLGHSS